jgi:FkbM family methyltransferase
MYASGGTIENEIFWKGLNNAFEPETVWIWKLLCPVSETIIDIGANTGMYSLIAKQINPTSKVYCFEPAHKTFKELVKNIQCNHFDIKAFDIAVSNTDSEKIFYDVFDEHQLSASLSPEKLKHNPSYVGAMNEYLVKTTTLDSFIQNRKINQVDLIKIDVEMHEPEVFDGMMHIMKFHRPIVIFEVLLSEQAELLNKFFYNKGYSLFHMEFDTVNGYYLKIVDKLIGLPESDWNYLACHIDKIWLLKKLGLL